jgi:hypothetical protein
MPYEKARLDGRHPDCALYHKTQTDTTARHDTGRARLLILLAFALDFLLFVGPPAAQSGQAPVQSVTPAGQSAPSAPQTQPAPKTQPLAALLERIPQPINEVTLYFASDRLAPEAEATPYVLDHDGPSYLMGHGPFAAEGRAFTLPRSART